jgi:Tol biopolymer transport system component
MVYQTVQETSNSRLVWFDREGNALDTVGEPKSYRDIALSPDEQRLAYVVGDPPNSVSDIWIYDLSRDVTSRLTFGSTNELFPLWSPDGKELIFARGNFPEFRAMTKPANGTGEARQIPSLSDSTTEVVSDISKDGRLVCVSNVKNSKPNLVIKNFQEASEAEEVSNSSFFEWMGIFSPNAKYLSYMSQESGRNEIYIRQLGESGKWQISNNGGEEAQWRADGKELFYRNRDFEIIAIPINTEGEFSVGTPVKLFQKRTVTAGFKRLRFVVTGDGQRFLLNVAPEEGRQVSFNVVINWAEELRLR